MLTRRLMTCCTLFALVVMFVACGDAEFSSSLDSELKVSDMSDEEAATFCEEGEAFEEDASDTMEELGCIFAAAFGAAFSEEGQEVQACEQTYDACMSGEMENMDEGAEYDDTCDIEEMDRSNCDATVGQIIACAEEELEKMEQVVSDFSCSDIADEDAAMEEEEMGPACQAVEDVCPGYMSDEMSSGNMGGGNMGGGNMGGNNYSDYDNM